MIDFNPIKIQVLSLNRDTRDKASYETISYVQFNNGYSHITIDDNLYLIVNGTGYCIPTGHIFPEAMDILKQLPSNPRIIFDRFKHVIYKDIEEYKPV